MESNPVSFQTPSPRDYSSLARKFREPEENDEELLLEEYVYLTPRPPAPPEEHKKNTRFEFIPDALSSFRKRKQIICFGFIFSQVNQLEILPFYRIFSFD